MYAKVANECPKIMIDCAEDTDRLRVGSIRSLDSVTKLTFITTELYQLAVYGE